MKFYDLKDLFFKSPRFQSIKIRISKRGSYHIELVQHRMCNTQHACLLAIEIRHSLQLHIYASPINILINVLLALIM